MELEVVLRDGQPETDGRAIAQHLLQRLGIASAHQVHGGYLDLLAQTR